MESLTYVVKVMLLAQVLLGVAPMTFAVLANFNGKFLRASLTLIIVLAVETACALWVLPAFGMPSLVALVVSVVVRWWPPRRVRDRNT
jgi:hypothetical protein